MKTNVGTVRIFIFSAGLLLFVTAVAKLTSSAGAAKILAESDPIFSISFRHVFWVVGMIELIIALVCLLGRRLQLQVRLLAWLATSFLFYRLALIWIDYHRPCSCLGNLTDALHVSPKTADVAMKFMLGYLLIGSYTGLIWCWWQKRKAETLNVAAQTPIVSA
jgi:hypothetical protein